MTVLRNLCPTGVRTHLRLYRRGLKCEQDVKEGVLACVNGHQAMTGPGDPVDVDGVKGKHEPVQ